MNIMDDSSIEKTRLKLEENLQKWPKVRWRHLLLGVFCLFFALYMIYCSAPSIFLPDHSLLGKIQIEDKPEDLSSELWLITEIRRNMAILELHNKMIAISLAECVGGIVLLIGSFFILVPVVANWKAGSMEIKLTRLLLAYHEELNRQNSP